MAVMIDSESKSKLTSSTGVLSSSSPPRSRAVVIERKRMNRTTRYIYLPDVRTPWDQEYPFALMSVPLSIRDIL